MQGMEDMRKVSGKVPCPFLLGKGNLSVQSQGESYYWLVGSLDPLAVRFSDILTLPSGSSKADGCRLGRECALYQAVFRLPPENRGQLTTCSASTLSRRHVSLIHADPREGALMVPVAYFGGDTSQQCSTFSMRLDGPLVLSPPSVLTSLCNPWEPSQNEEVFGVLSTH